jgi:glycerophosphoryl diester phosphodiesterase
MSFDPAAMSAIKDLAPAVPRGIVSGIYQGDGWWLDRLDAERAYRLSHLLESRQATPDFFSYHVKALPTPVTRFVREVLGLPLFTWTVRTAEDRTIAEKWADAITFEGFEP